MECEGEWLSSYLDGELGAEQTAEVERHLEACPACRASLQELRQLTEVVGRSVPDAPQGLADYILSAIPHPAMGHQAAGAYVSLATNLGIGLALVGAALLAVVAPRLVGAWRVLQKFIRIMWAAGTWQVSLDRVLVAAGVLGLAALLVAGAIYGTRLLNRMGEVSL